MSERNRSRKKEDLLNLFLPQTSCHTILLCQHKNNGPTTTTDRKQHLNQGKKKKVESSAAVLSVNFAEKNSPRRTRSLVSDSQNTHVSSNKRTAAKRGKSGQSVTFHLSSFFSRAFVSRGSRVSRSLLYSPSLADQS